MVKIGRTDRDVETRMDELSNDDYGVEGFSGDSEWKATHFFQVKDNEAAERLIHENFDDLRVSDNRELFYSDDPTSIAKQAAEISGGNLIDAADPSILEAADPAFLEQAFEKLVHVGLMLEVGVIATVAAQLVHKQIKDKPKYKEQVKKVDAFYEESKENLYKLNKHPLSQEYQEKMSEGFQSVKTKWDNTKDDRKKIADDSEKGIKKLWGGSSKFIKNTIDRFKS